MFLRSIANQMLTCICLMCNVFMNSAFYTFFHINITDSSKTSLVESGLYFLSNVFYGDRALIDFKGLQLIYPRYHGKTKAYIPSATTPFMQSCVSAVNRLTQYYLQILEFRLMFNVSYG